MSRTVVSDTDSTPSIIDSASPSTSLRSKAPRMMATRSSRSSGSRISSAESRSSSVGLSWPGSFLSSSMGSWASARGVRVGEPEGGQDRGFPRLHHRGVGVPFVVESLQVQHAVDNQVRVMVGERLALRGRLPPHDRRAEHDVAGARMLVIVHEGEDVRRVVLAAEFGVERAALDRVDEAHRRRSRRPAARRGPSGGPAGARAGPRRCSRIAPKATAPAPSRRAETARAHQRRFRSSDLAVAASRS